MLLLLLPVSRREVRFFFRSGFRSALKAIGFGGGLPSHCAFCLEVELRGAILARLVCFESSSVSLLLLLQPGASLARLTREPPLARHGRYTCRYNSMATAPVKGNATARFGSMAPTDGGELGGGVGGGSGGGGGGHGGGGFGDGGGDGGGGGGRWGGGGGGGAWGAGEGGGKGGGGTDLISWKSENVTVATDTSAARHAALHAPSSHVCRSSLPHREATRYMPSPHALELAALERDGRLQDGRRVMAHYAHGALCAQHGASTHTHTQTQHARAWSAGRKGEAR